jgi:hypothetical protein
MWPSKLNIRPPAKGCGRNGRWVSMAHQHVAKVRFTAGDHEWIARQAAAAGESFSEFVRTAALARAWMVYAWKHPEGVGDLAVVYERTRRLLEDESARADAMGA